MTLIELVDTLRDWTKGKFQEKGEYLENGDLDEYSLISETGSSLSLNMDPSTFIVTATLKDKNGNELASDDIDLPLETMIVNVSFDADTKSLTITLKNGTVLDPIPVSDITSGLVPSDRKIAGLSLENDITVDSLKSALGINNKVDKVDGKELSSNDFTDDYKELLDDLNDITEDELMELLNGTSDQS